MTETAIETAAPEGAVLTVLTYLNDGQTDEAVAGFAEGFRFQDYGLGLEFKDKDRLSEFFRKTRELYPDGFLEPDTIFVSGDQLAMKWTLRTTVTESFYGGLSRRVQVSVRGASIVRSENGKITDWADYYDGVSSRRTALAAHFEEWVEL